ncbi:SDR family NAD(P)-dependent oxidoreductase [Streptomyces sp. NPDC101149]|uniref:SDR family NAD(P)-dependent oxidoreductase n=1 Tax=Streptomyces sp. NPDC101149 TaxID=3366113 RepID=UPI0037F9CB9A
MADQQGRTFVVTGATSGLGLVTARELAAHGGRVLLAVRDAARGEEVASSLRRAYPGAEVEVRRVDLLDLRSIRRAAEEIGEEEAVDVLINNAGISIPDLAWVSPASVGEGHASSGWRCVAPELAVSVR